MIEQLVRQLSEARHQMIETFLLEKAVEFGVAPETLASTHRLVFIGDDYLFSETAIQIKPNWELLTNEEYKARYGHAAR